MAPAPGHPGFAALLPWIGEVAGGVAGVDGVTLERLNAWAARADPAPVTATGARVRFVAAGARASAIAYESRILETGEVALRPGSRHDAFNALCWIAFPNAKRACNALHVTHAAGEAGSTIARGAVRDALTLFDESGVIALAADPALAELLVARQWKALFSARRDEAMRSMRFFVFGHALFEKLADPWPGITGRVMIVAAEGEAFDSGASAGSALRAIADAKAARALDALRSAAGIPPLPLAGIPGWDRRNDNPAFYDDASVFRPPIASGRSATLAQSADAPASTSSSREP